MTTMANLVIHYPAKSVHLGLANLPNELLLQVMFDVGAESIQSLFNLLRSCKTAWRAWHGAEPAVTSQAPVTTSDRYHTQMRNLMEVAVSPAVFPALVMAWTTNKLMMERRGGGHSQVPILAHLRLHYGQQTPPLPAGFGLRGAHEIQALDRATAGIAEMFWGCVINSYQQPYPEDISSLPFSLRAAEPADELEIHRVQRALCMHEHFRCIERDAPGSFGGSSLSGFSEAEVRQFMEVTGFLRCCIGGFSCNIQHNRPGTCFFRSLSDHCERLYTLRLVLHPVTVLKLLRASDWLRASTWPLYDRPDRVTHRNRRHPEIVKALESETDLTRPDPDDPNRMIQIDLDALFAEDRGVSSPDRDPHEQLDGLSEGIWVFENDDFFISSHHISDTNRFPDPDPGPREFIRQDAHLRAVRGRLGYCRDPYQFFNDQRRRAAMIGTVIARNGFQDFEIMMG